MVQVRLNKRRHTLFTPPKRLEKAACVHFSLDRHQFDVLTRAATSSQNIKPARYNYGSRFGFSWHYVTDTVSLRDYKERFGAIPKHFSLPRRFFPSRVQSERNRAATERDLDVGAGRTAGSERFRGHRDPRAGLWDARRAAQDASLMSGVGGQSW